MYKTNEVSGANNEHKGLVDSLTSHVLELLRLDIIKVVNFWTFQVGGV